MQMACLHVCSLEGISKQFSMGMLQALYLLAEHLLSPKNLQDGQHAELTTCSSDGHCPGGEGGQRQLDKRKMLLVTSEGST